MNKLVETIEWAVIMGFNPKRTNFKNGDIVIYVPEIKTNFWFDSDYDLELVENLKTTLPDHFKHILEDVEKT